MVKLTFNFNQAEVKKAGLTEDELLAEVREFAKQNDIAETSFGVFEKEGENAMAQIGKIILDIISEKPDYVLYLKQLMFDVNGRREDALKATKNWLKKQKVSGVNNG